MKLLTKTSLLYLLFAVPVMVICSYICFYLIQDEVIKNTDEALMKDFVRVERALLKKDSVIDFTSVNGEIIVRPSQLQYLKTDTSYSDTTMYDDYEEEMLPFRVLKIKYAGEKADYDVIVRKIYLESEDLTDGILTAMEIMFGFLLLGFFVINFFVSRSLWKPFRKTLSVLDKYDVNKKEEIKFDSVSTKEFRQLNSVLNSMTEKIQRDYKNLKEFTENASHEIQTPLAIIRSKLELMIQSENLSEDQVKSVQDIYESVNRLSKLNQSLLLLAKIENHQFHDEQEVDLKNLIEKKLEQFEDMIAFKNISVEKKFIASPEKKMNLQLADILLSNILGNAIRHNLTDGKISIELNAGLLIISNSGNPLEVSPEKLFERFQKASSSSESVGLGLSIVKQICDTYNFKVNYTYKGNLHTVSVYFYSALNK